MTSRMSTLPEYGFVVICWSGLLYYRSCNENPGLLGAKCFVCMFEARGLRPWAPVGHADVCFGAMVGDMISFESQEGMPQISLSLPKSLNPRLNFQSPSLQNPRPLCPERGCSVGSLSCSTLRRTWGSLLNLSPSLHQVRSVASGARAGTEWGGSHPQV